MARKSRVRLRGTRTTPKVEQKRMLKRLAKLRDDPAVLLPDCDRQDRRCSYCPYPKVLRELQRAGEKHGSSLGLLGRVFGSRLTDGMARAYAASLTVLEAGELPVVAVARFPAGEVSYVQRGSTLPKEKFIGVQNHHHQVWRALAHLDYVKRARIHLYSLPDKLWCTGRKPDFPPQLWEQVQNELPKGAVAGDGDEGLTITCQSLDRSVHLSPAAWKRSKRNTFRVLVGHQMAPTEEADFDVTAMTPLSEAAPEALTGLLRDYHAGKFIDRELRLKLVEAQLKEIAAGEAPLVVLGERAMEPAAVPEALALEGDDRRLAELLLEGLTGPLLLTEATLAALARERWEARGYTLVGQWSPGAARDHDGDNALQLLRRAWRARAETQLLSRLPRYRKLPAPVALADRAARTRLVEGVGAAAKAVEAGAAHDRSAQAVGWALLLALNRAAGQEWRFGQSERDFGAELVDAADALLTAEPDDYHDALAALAQAAGVTTSLESV